MLAAQLLSTVSPPPTLLFFPPPGTTAATYRALLQSLPGYRILAVKPRSSPAAWQRAASLSAVEQLAFERREIEAWVEEALRVLRANKLASAGAFGHGAGGLAAAAACQISSSFRACLNIDGEVLGSPFLLEAGFEQPFLWLRPLREASPPPTSNELKARGMTQADYDDAISRSGPAAQWKSRCGSTLVTLYAKDADTESFTSARATSRSFQLASIIIGQYFDEQMRGRPSPLLHGYATGFPEVVVQQYLRSAHTTALPLRK